MNEAEEDQKAQNSSLISNLIHRKHTPDILTCIANLSSDEVFTPPELADKILDTLPEEVWHNKNLKWLDPACKTGIFLRQITKRLMAGLKDEIPDEAERRQHILRNMVFGIAITDLTALMSRRSVYTSKSANGDKSIAKFDSQDGNISYDNRPHTYQNGCCIYCGNKEGGELDRDETEERHAYNFIHLTREELSKMHFDVIVGNPPYQLSDGGNGASASPIYQFFIMQAKKLSPRYMAFIIPSRWFAGGKGLDAFRNEMLHDKRIKHLVDYPNASDCFPGVDIKGGVCYFVWDKDYDGKCAIDTCFGENPISSMSRCLDEYDTFVRWNQGIPILKKIQSRDEETIEKEISSRKPFGLATNFDLIDGINNTDKYKIYANKKIGFVYKTCVQKGQKYIDKWKVMMPKATEGSGVYPNYILSKPIIAEPYSVCTETYIILKSFKAEDDAKKFANYVQTRFFRFLVSLRKITQDATSKVYSFVPDLPMDRVWTDEKLYDRYDITPDEQAFIESMIKEML